MPVKNLILLGDILQPRHDIAPIRERLYPLVTYGDEASMILIHIYFLKFLHTSDVDVGVLSSTIAAVGSRELRIDLGRGA